MTYHMEMATAKDRFTDLVRFLYNIVTFIKNSKEDPVKITEEQIPQASINSLRNFFKVLNDICKMDGVLSDKYYLYIIEAFENGNEIPLMPAFEFFKYNCYVCENGITYEEWDDIYQASSSLLDRFDSVFDKP